MKVMRSDVIKALEKEPILCAGEILKGSLNPNCAVCAVGAVLRRVGVTQSNLDLMGRRITNHQYSASSSLPLALKEQNWLGAISIKWEQLARKVADKDLGPGSYSSDLTPDQTEKLRKPMLKWVREKIPKGVLFNGVV